QRDPVDVGRGRFGSCRGGQPDPQQGQQNHDHPHDQGNLPGSVDGKVSLRWLDTGRDDGGRAVAGRGGRGAVGRDGRGLVVRGGRGDDRVAHWSLLSEGGGTGWLNGVHGRADLAWIYQTLAIAIKSLRFGHLTIPYN